MSCIGWLRRSEGGFLVRSLAAAVAVLFVAWAAPARAQVSDAERAVARQLFLDGDALQRAGKFSEALDKFQRAESAYSAPTNVLRIAECQAALGELVESAESYRSALRMPVAPGSPAALQAAVAQARGELAQVEPRVPQLIVLVSPAGAQGADIQIDGQHVSSALLGEPIPLDPGDHRVQVSAPGFLTFAQAVSLKEHETSSVSVTLRPVANTAPAPPPPLPSAPPAPESAPPPQPAPVAIVPAPPPYQVPPPAQIPADRDVSGAQPPRVSLLFGAHLGWEVAAGKLPTDTGPALDTSTVATSGFAYALEGGLSFARHFYLGLNLEHAQLGHGDLSSLPNNVTDASASTTLLGAVIGFVGNLERPSFYGEIGAAIRWLSLTETTGTTEVPLGYSSGELTLGLGVWVPLGPAVRLLPKITLGIGSCDTPQGSVSSAEGHSFAMLGLAGYYNLEL